ncbi:MAG: hypothetical protein HN380_01535 [Victivallales bacterium]|nr:hypothetical protein [Victivallales bacterium]
MHCEHCQQNEATIHLMVGEAGGQKQALHLCLACALKGGDSSDSPIPPGELVEVLKQFGEKIGLPFPDSAADAGPESPPEEPVSAVCPDCGTSDAMFRRQQRLGCPTCYEIFAEDIRELLPSLHRKGVPHRGRGPTGTGTGTSRARDRLLRGQRLRQQLGLAVAAEDYERASLLRDEIKSLASVDDGPGDGS